MLCTQPVDGGPKEKKKMLFDPSFGNQPSARGNQTPDIKLNFERSLPSNTGNYDPWGKGTGNPSWDEKGNTLRKSSTLNSTRVNTTQMHECSFNLSIFVTQ